MVLPFISKAISPSLVATITLSISSMVFDLSSTPVNTNCFLSELNAESFDIELYHKEEGKADLKIYDWRDSDQWGDFDLAKLAEKEIRKNRQYIDAVLKNKA